MDYRKLDTELLDVAQRCVSIHEALHRDGFKNMTGEEFGSLYHTNLNNYIAFTAHALFEAGIKDAVVVLGSVHPDRKPEFKTLLDHNKAGLRFTKEYAQDIADYKRQVIVEVFYLDGSHHYAMFGVRDVAAEEHDGNKKVNPIFN